MAYNFIPTTKKEILVQPEFVRAKKAQAHVVVLFEYLRRQFREIEDPIALDPSNPTQVKVTRKITSVLPVPTLLRNAGVSGIRVTPGEGSRGNRGAGNRGNAFEQQLQDDIMRWVEGVPIKNTAHAAFIEEFVNYYKITKFDTVEVIPEGALNQKRPLIIQGEALFVGSATDPDIGKTVTDLTVKTEDVKKKSRTIYLSLKYGATVTFFNVGIAKFITATDFQQGKISSPEGKQILKLFGLDEKKFLDTFSNSGKIYPPENVTSKINKGRLTAFIKSGIGYGYHLVHLLNNRIDHFEMTKQFLEKSSQPQSVQILYGGASGNAKRVDILVETANFKLKFNLRNKAGGINPNFILCDYKKKH